MLIITCSCAYINRAVFELAKCQRTRINGNKDREAEREEEMENCHGPDDVVKQRGN